MSDLEMGRLRGPVPDTCSLLRVLTYASVCTCLLNLSVLVVCLSAGRWVFGEAVCQVFAFVSHVTVGGSAWLLALTGLERYYKLFLPAEHQCIFSDINTRILVIGIYLLVAVIVTSPLYGWGEYTEFRGYFHLTISLSEAGSEDQTSLSSNTPVSNTSQSNLTTSNTTAYCMLTDTSPGALPVDELNITEFTQIIQSSLKMRWGIQARLWSFGPNLTYLLRAQSTSSLQTFIRSYHDSSVSGHLLAAAYTDCDCQSQGRFLCESIHVNLTEVEEYRSIFLPFQSPMICSIDFTTVNKAGAGWLAFFVLTTAVMPFGFMIVMATVIMVQWRHIPLDVSRSDCVRTGRLLVGSGICALLYSPYFVVNIVNSLKVYISPPIHEIALFIYYSCFIVPCIMCGDKSCLRRSSTNRSPPSQKGSMEDIEFQLLQTAQI
ncbi:uncharacterized protein LOC125374908 [Haliotis rufescens]|uniref:uncharacterized protein LOC125374908 n=1 Tax=Haliotis rufescens TaxID=6454 RepID=UPI00201E9F80|nr:uncharacterized protein LOC125374908 [Haliotis rufescens]